jgi:hypothetical protein
MLKSISGSMSTSVHEGGPESVDEGGPEIDLTRRASGDLDEIARAVDCFGGQPRRIDANEENAGKGVAKLVLSLVELIRRLLEKQAIRRMDAGTVSDEQIERMGETFLKLTEKVEEMKAAFDLEGEDLDIGLGSIRELTEREDGHGDH